MQNATADAGGVAEQTWSPREWDGRSWVSELDGWAAQAWSRMRLRTSDGRSAVPDEELLALVVWSGEAKGEELARALIRKFGSLAAVFDASCEALAAVRGVSPSEALRIKAMHEAVGRLAKAALALKPRCPRRLKDYLVATRRFRTTHDLGVLYLSPDDRLVADERVGGAGLALGTRLSTGLLPEIARRALELGVMCVAPVEVVPHTGSTPSLAALRRSRVLQAMLQPLDIMMMPYRVLTRDHLLTIRWGKTRCEPAPGPAG